MYENFQRTYYVENEFSAINFKVLLLLNIILLLKTLVLDLLFYLKMKCNFRICIRVMHKYRLYGGFHGTFVRQYVCKYFIHVILKQVS